MSDENGLLPWGKLTALGSPMGLREVEELTHSKHCIGSMRTRCDIIIDRNYIGGLHCIIALQGKDDRGNPIVEVENTSRRYGTFINRNKMGYRTKTNLKSGDIIHFATPDSKMEPLAYCFEILPTGFTLTNEDRHAQLSVAGRVRKRAVEDTQNTQSSPRSQHQASLYRGQSAKRARLGSHGSSGEVSPTSATQQEPEPSPPPTNAAGKKRHRSAVPAEDSLLAQRRKKQEENRLTKKQKEEVEVTKKQLQEEYEIVKMRQQEEFEDQKKQEQEKYETRAREQTKQLMQVYSEAIAEHRLAARDAEAREKAAEDKAVMIEKRLEALTKSHKGLETKCKQLEQAPAQLKAAENKVIALAQEVENRRQAQERLEKAHEKALAAQASKNRELSQKLEAAEKTICDILASNVTPSRDRSVVELVGKYTKLQCEMKRRESLARQLLADLTRLRQDMRRQAQLAQLALVHVENLQRVAKALREC